MRYFGILLIMICQLMPIEAQDFVAVKGNLLYLHDKPYRFIGTNYWYGMNLGANLQAGDRERLLRELDFLHEKGIDNLRIMGGTEGPDSEPWRVTPSLQTAPGVYNDALWEGLDFLLDEMGKRNMKAVVCLNNFWQWTGGMAQYHSWFGGGPIPYPTPDGQGDWWAYCKYTAKFYRNKKAKRAFQKFIRKIVGRVNSISGIAYAEDPTIMSWQLANEPRGINKKRSYRKWIKKTAGLIKSMDEKHLLSIGSEGTTPGLFNGNRFEKDHAYDDIDYTTIHVWIQNWGWYDPMDADKTFVKSLEEALAYIENQEHKAKQLGKPMVIEEFGIARDGNDHDPSANTQYRDLYFEYMCRLLLAKLEEKSPLCGINFWAFGGEGRPFIPKGIWERGQDLIGDPPHEFQGWYSVYDQDGFTWQMLAPYIAKLNMTP